MKILIYRWYLQGCFRLCNCFSLRCLVLWINHLPLEWQPISGYNFPQMIWWYREQYEMKCCFTVKDSETMNQWVKHTHYTGADQARLNTLRPRQNGCHFPVDILKWNFLNENVWILIKISLKLVPKVPIKNIPGLVQIMAWRRPGARPLSEPMTVSLLI